MKKVIVETEPIEYNEDPELNLQSVPDIDNRYVTLDTVLSWLDRLVEVHNNEENISNN